MADFDKYSTLTPPTPDDIFLFKDAETGNLKNCNQLQLSESVGYVPEPDPELATFQLEGTEYIEVLKDGVKYYATLPTLIAEPQTYQPSISPTALTTAVRNQDAKIEGDLTGNAASSSKVGALTPVGLDIPPWDMTTTQSVDVTHGVDAAKIQLINTLIRPDDGVTTIGAGSIEQRGGLVTIGATVATIDRGASGYYNTDNATNFNQTGIYNRGRLTLWMNDFAMNATEEPAPIASLGTLAAFPGAEGYGAATVGGRGGAIVKVTNLNDSGAGSLRQALYYTPGPRIVVFEVSGQINLLTSLNIVEGNVTVAGQTAPSPGISLKGQVSIRASQVIWRHVRVRGYNGGPEEGIQVYGSSLIQNIVIDHSSVAWTALDEPMSLAGTVKNVTLSNNLIGESLNFRTTLFGGFLDNVSYLRNMHTNSAERHPRFNIEVGPACNGHTINNLIFNHSGDGMVMNGLNKNSIVGNIFVDGTHTTYASRYMVAGTSPGILAGSELYLTDNVFWNNRFLNTMADGFDVVTPPSSLSGLTILTSAELEAALKLTAGARPADRDTIDARLISELTARTSRRVTDEDQVGGFPVLAQNARTLTLPTDPNGIYVDSWTNMDKWLHDHAITVEEGA